MMFNDHVLLKRELTATEPKYGDPANKLSIWFFFSVQLLIKRNINQSKNSDYYSKIYVEPYRKQNLQLHENTRWP